MKFTTILKNVILEQSRMEVLADKLTKPQGEKKKIIMTPEELFALVVADPESKIVDGVDIDNFDGDFNKVKKVGPYTQWLIKQYLSIVPSVNGEVIPKEDEKEYKSVLKKIRGQFWEDLYKTTEDLKKFHRHKNKLPQELRDINKLTIETLFDNVKDFSLEKEKATKDDRKEASKTFIFPGSDLIYDGPNWVVTKVTDKGQAGKEAACFFGGFNQETRWCTSAPGLNWFDRYIKDGPLYQVFKKGGETADKTGLPKERYQFHFPSGQFMDINDRQINLVEFLKDSAPELKEVFKPEFAKGLTKHDGKELHMEYPNDSSSKFVALYGWDDFFKSIDQGLESFDFSNKSRQPLTMKFPKELGNLKNLQTFFVEDAIDEVPEQLKNLKNLEFLSLPNNRNLKELPEWIADLPNLIAISVKGTPSDLKIPERLRKTFTQNGGKVWFVHND